MCGKGPLSERDIADLQKADGTKPVGGRSKSGYSVNKIVSSPGSSSSKEVLTLLSSDDEDEAPSSQKKDVKSNGKKAAKITEITLDSDSDEERSNESEYMPSSPPRSQALDPDPEVGRLESSDDDDDAGGGRRPMLLSDTQFRASTKLEALVRSLQAAKQKDPGLKAVVFSQVCSASRRPSPR